MAYPKPELNLKIYFWKSNTDYIKTLGNAATSYEDKVKTASIEYDNTSYLALTKSHFREVKINWKA